MITSDVVVLLFLAIIPGIIAIFLLISGVYAAVSESDMGFCLGMTAASLVLFFFSGIVLNESYKEYKNATPQNQVKILRQKIINAENELQKYLIDHPELKEE